MFHALVFLPVCLSLCGKLLKPHSEESTIRVSTKQGVDNRIFTLDDEDISKEKKITMTSFKVSVREY